jgi:valyl-tRNA synthetase
VTAGLETYDLGLSAQKIYDFAWSEFCDWYIEMAKPRLSDAAGAPVARAVLYHVLIGLLKLLHPFMPFITDEVYHHLPGADGSIMVSNWPEADAAHDFPEDEARMEGVMDIIRTVRNLRAEMNVAAGRKARLIVRPREARPAGSAHRRCRDLLQTPGLREPAGADRRRRPEPGKGRLRGDRRLPALHAAGGPRGTSTRSWRG